MSPVTLTASAVAHIQHQLEKTENACGLSLAVRKTGCSGYAFKPEIVTAIPEDALSFHTPEGLSVYVDKASLPFFQGVMIDYKAETTGLKQKRLVFINPNETGRCGCGESFTVE